MTLPEPFGNGDVDREWCAKTLEFAPTLRLLWLLPDLAAFMAIPLGVQDNRENNQRERIARQTTWRSRVGEEKLLVRDSIQQGYSGRNGSTITSARNNRGGAGGSLRSLLRNALCS